MKTQLSKWFCHPLMRTGYGNAGITMQQPSRFLDEIPKDYLDEWNLQTYG